MKKLLFILLATAALTGCASRTGTAALAGGAIGYILANEANQKPAVVVVEPPRQVRCHTRYIGQDQYGRAVYQQVCH
jgi:uncharacterized lipoprotein YajG